MYYFEHEILVSRLKALYLKSQYNDCNEYTIGHRSELKAECLELGKELNKLNKNFYGAEITDTLLESEKLYMDLLMIYGQIFHILFYEDGKKEVERILKQAERFQHHIEQYKKQLMGGRDSGGKKDSGV